VCDYYYSKKFNIYKSYILGVFDLTKAEYYSSFIETLSQKEVYTNLMFYAIKAIDNKLFFKYIRQLVDSKTANFYK
jgi:hypothetical protein